MNEILIGTNSLKKEIFLKLLKCYKLKGYDKNIDFIKIVEDCFRLYLTYFEEELLCREENDNLFQILRVKNFAYMYDIFISLKYSPSKELVETII